MTEPRAPAGSGSAGSAPADGGPGRLRADCARCFGLCCVAPAFSASADFAIDKPAGQPCPNLRPGFRCGIHDDLRPRGFRGCAVYDCFGAGQHVSQVTFGGQDWRQAPRAAQQMFEVFAVMRQLHELLWYLSEALASRRARPLHGELKLAIEATDRMAGGGAEALLELDLGAHRRDVHALLRRASELMRAGVPGPEGEPRGSRPGRRQAGGRQPQGSHPEGGLPDRRRSHRR